MTSSTPWYFRLKLYFITLFFGYGCVMPYLSLFYRAALGFTSLQIGVLTSIVPVMNFLLAPQWTYLADRYQTHKTILVLNNIASSVVMFGLTMLRPEDPNAFGYTVVIIIFFSAFLSPLNSIMDTLILNKLQLDELKETERRKVNPELAKQPRADSTTLYGRQRMWGSLAYGAAGFLMGELVKSVLNGSGAGTENSGNIDSCGGTSNTTILDNSCSLLSDAANGTTMTTFGTTPSTGDSSLNLLFYSYMVAAGILFSLTLLWPSKEESEDRKEFAELNGDSAPTTPMMERSAKTDGAELRKLKTGSRSSVNSKFQFTPPPVPALSKHEPVHPESPSFFQALRTIYKHRSAVGSPIPFWIFVFVQGFSLSIVNNYVFLMLVDQLHASSTILGLISLARVSLEIPFFFWSGSIHGWIVRTVGRFVPVHPKYRTEDGMRWTMAISMALLALRLGIYALMSYGQWNPWIDVAVELLHGVIYALFYSAAIKIASYAPSHLNATSQGIFGAIFSGFGSSTGTFLGGLVYDVLGATVLFAGLFVLTLVTTCGYAFTILHTQRDEMTLVGNEYESSQRFKAVASEEESLVAA